MSHITNSIESNSIQDVDNTESKQEIENSETMDSNKQHAIKPMVQGAENNLAHTVVQNVPHNTMDLIRNNIFNGIDEIQNIEMMDPNTQHAFIQMIQDAQNRVLQNVMMPHFNFF